MEGRDETREHVLGTLISDHEHIADCLKQYRQATAPQQKQSAADAALKELSVHCALEEEIFFPWVKVKKPLIAELIDRCVQQHLIFEGFANQLSKMKAADIAYDHVFSELSQGFSEHIQFEVNEVFVQLSDLDLGSLAPLLQQRREELTAGRCRQFPGNLQAPPPAMFKESGEAGSQGA